VLEVYNFENRTQKDLTSIQKAIIGGRWKLDGGSLQL